MNDFTKEELQHIYDGLWMLSKLGWEKSDLTKCKKIAAMIDEYPKCDHRSGIGFYNEQGERVHYDTDIYRCRHCDILFRFVSNNGVCIGHEDLK